MKIQYKLNGHILLAEDNEDNQALISYFIKKTGASVSIAENGKVAVDMAQNNDFDLILMDMQMPEMSGVEATTQLRKLGNQVPIVALTANATREDKEACKEAGSDGFVAKPIEQEEFYTVLKNYLQEALE